MSSGSTVIRPAINEDMTGFTPMLIPEARSAIENIGVFIRSQLDSAQVRLKTRNMKEV